MNQITAEDFKEEILKNPAWATTVSEPTEVRGRCQFQNSTITHLSPLLHFMGTRWDPTTNFSHCEKLTNAEGHFHGCVNFHRTGIKKIGELHIHPNPNWETGPAVSFSECPWIETAEGNFEGCADFSRSGISRIGNLRITKPDELGWAAHFCLCTKLQEARGDFHGAASFSDSGITKIGELHITAASTSGYAADFTGCKGLKTAEGNFPGFTDFTASGIEKVAGLTITGKTLIDIQDSEGDIHIPKGIAGAFIDCNSLHTAPPFLLEKEFLIEHQLRKEILEKMTRAAMQKNQGQIEI